MKTSPFLRNRQHKLAALAGTALAATAAPKAPDEGTEAGQEYAVLRVQLHENLRQLQDTASHEARKPMKAQFSHTFRPWIEGILAADRPVQDEILLTNFVWAIDTGCYEGAVELGAFAIKHGLAMPDGYKRSVACFLREDIAEVAIADPAAVDLQLLLKIDALTAAADMPDAAKAKLHKALGRSWAAKADAFDATADNAPAGGAAAYTHSALTELRRALELDKHAGVRKDIERLERRLRDLSPAGEGQDGIAGQPGGGSAGGAAVPPAVTAPAQTDGKPASKPAARPRRSQSGGKAQAARSKRAAAKK